MSPDPSGRRRRWSKIAVGRKAANAASRACRAAPVAVRLPAPPTPRPSQETAHARRRHRTSANGDAGAAARRSARDPRPWRRHRASRARADRRVAAALSPPSRHRRRRRLAGRGASRGRQRAQLRVPAPGRRILAGFRRRPVRRVRRRPRAPAQHHRLPGRDHRGAGGPRSVLRVHGARFQLRLPDDPFSRRRRDVLRRANRSRRLRALPGGAAGVRIRRHRGVARATSRPARAGVVHRRAVVMDRGDAAQVLSRASDRSDSARRTRCLGDADRRHR